MSAVNVFSGALGLRVVVMDNLEVCLECGIVVVDSRPGMEVENLAGLGQRAETEECHCWEVIHLLYKTFEDRRLVEVVHSLGSHHQVVDIAVPIVPLMIRVMTRNHDVL